MAELDTSIPLSYKAPQADFAGAAEKGLNLRALMLKPELMQQQILQSQAETRGIDANTANALAQRAGLEAASEKARREMDYKRWLGANSAKFKIEGKVGPDGKKAQDGFDYVAAADDAAAAGFPEHSEQLRGAAIITRGNEAKNADDFRKYADEARAYTANRVKHLPAQLQEAEWNKALENLEQRLPGSAAAIGPYSPERIRSVVEGTVTQTQREQNRLTEQGQAIQREQVAQSGAGSGTDAAARDPNSAISKATRATLAQNGIQVPDNLSHAAAMQNPQWKALASANVISPEAKSAAKARATQFEQKANAYDGVDAILKRLQSRGMMDPKNKASAWLNENQARFQNDPDVLALQTAVAQTPDLDWQGKDAAGLSAQAQDLARLARQNAKAETTTVEGQTFAPLKPAPAQPAAKPKGAEKLPQVNSKEAFDKLPKGAKFFNLRTNSIDTKG